MAGDAGFGDTAMATTVFSGNLAAVKLVVSIQHCYSSI